MKTVIPLLAVALVACDASPWTVESRYHLTPPAAYVEWFAEVATCLGKREVATAERFARIRWFAGLEIHDGEGTGALGLWTRPNQITIREDRIDARHVVKHEMIHDLLQDTQHPSPYFDVCAD